MGCIASWFHKGCTWLHIVVHAMSGVVSLVEWDWLHTVVNPSIPIFWAKVIFLSSSFIKHSSLLSILKSFYPKTTLWRAQQSDNIMLTTFETCCTLGRSLSLITRRRFKLLFPYGLDWLILELRTALLKIKSEVVIIEPVIFFSFWTEFDSE